MIPRTKNVFRIKNVGTSGQKGSCSRVLQVTVLCIVLSNGFHHRWGCHTGRQRCCVATSGWVGVVLTGGTHRCCLITPMMSSGHSVGWGWSPKLLPLHTPSGADTRLQPVHFSTALSSSRRCLSHTGVREKTEMCLGDDRQRSAHAGQKRAPGSVPSLQGVPYKVSLESPVSRCALSLC